MPTITFVPRHIAETMRGAGKVVLSITHPGEIADMDHFQSVWRLAFDDIEIPISGHTMFDLDMAQGVINILGLGYPELVVHCEAGMSRSAAIALWADRNGYAELVYTDGALNTAQHYNRHVYRTLDAAAGKDMASYYAELERNDRMMGD